MDKEEVEIRIILDSVVKAGAYNAGHILWIKKMIHRTVAELQSDIKNLLDIRDCSHED